MVCQETILHMQMYTTTLADPAGSLPTQFAGATGRPRLMPAFFLSIRRKLVKWALPFEESLYFSALVGAAEMRWEPPRAASVLKPTLAASFMPLSSVFSFFVFFGGGCRGVSLSSSLPSECTTAKRPDGGIPATH